MLRCSADPSKNPTYRPVGVGYHSFVIREGGLGWIWPSVTGGCAHSLGSGLQLQRRGNDLFDSKNRKVGAITDQTLLAQNFETLPDKIFVEKLEFSLVSPAESKLDVKFRSPHYRGVFTYSATYRRFL